MKAYASLTERGQARRLRGLAFNALKHYDLEVSRLSLITNSVNGIFRLDTRSGGKWILRVSLPEGGHSIEHVEAEMDWLEALSNDTSLSVPRPFPARNGRLVIQAKAPGVPEPRLCAVFSWVPGTDLARHISPTTMAGLGELAARLHQHALTYAPSPKHSLLRFDKVFLFPEPVILFEKQFATLFTPQRRMIFQKAVDWAQDSIDQLKASGEAMRIVHGDLHQWNVRFSHGVLSPIDFEDLMWGWPVQDIATTLYYLMDMETFPTLRAAFQEGYTRQTDWPERHVGEIDSFIAARGLGLANFVLNYPDPARVQAMEFMERIERRLRKLMGNIL